MAKRRPTTTDIAALKDTSEDAFASRVFYLVEWVRTHLQAVIIGGVALAVVAFAGIFILRQQSNNLDLAAAEFETVQNVALTSEATTAVSEIQAYIDRFGDTPYAEEAQVLLGQIYLQEGQPDEAITALQDIAPDFESTTGIHATLLLGIAYEEAERWSEASEVYEEVLARGEYAYQKQDAAESLSRVHLASGDTVAALSALEGLRDLLEADDPRRATIEMKISEIQASQL